MFDYFVAALHCRRCGNVSPATAITGMQTHVRSDADGSELGVGFSFEPIDLTTTHILGAGYALITAPRGGSIRLLDVWTCPRCQTEEWAMVEILGGRIERIESALINRATLEAADFISDVSADLLAAALMGISSAELTRRKLSNVEVLRQRLG